ncbi:MAG: putative RDD family membrane protein YckC [Bacteroidia bacterium]|jgi:uncharacterized RDD family membrane protein YckC
MRTIEITTTQNVVIQVKLATLMDRIIGFIVDLIIIAVSFMILLSVVAAILVQGDSENWWILTILSILFAFYSLILEVLLRGQTLGKMVMGVKVIKVDGGQPEFIDYFRRWAIRWIDIWASFGAVGMISISTSDKGQRLGDKISDTIVVKKKQASGYHLKDILSITSSETYVPVYPEVKAINEKNMLTVKRLLNRYQKYPSIDTYTDLIRKTSKAFEAQLDLKRKEKNHVAFLKQLLKDYVILTR